jgi:DNA-directed RNA polymerase alpha subunit
MTELFLQSYHEYLYKILDRWTRETERSIWAGHYESEKDKINLCFDITNSKAKEVFGIDCGAKKEAETNTCVETPEPELKVNPTPTFTVVDLHALKANPPPTFNKKDLQICIFPKDNPGNDKTIRELCLPSHLHNVLHKYNLKLVSELSSLKQNQIEKMFSHNEKHLLELMFELNKHGIKHNISLTKSIREEIESRESYLPIPTPLKNVISSPEVDEDPEEDDQEVEKKEIIKISDFEFCPRTHSRLSFAEIKTLDQLLAKSSKDLLKIKSFGNSHLKVIIDDLNANEIKHSFKVA